MGTMRLINSNPGILKTNPEREMRRKARTPQTVNAVMRNIKGRLQPRQKAEMLN